MAVIRPTEGGILLDIRVVPRAGRSGITGTRDGALLVRLNAPPVEGAANAELVEVLAKALEVPRPMISLVSGEHARNKRIHVAGISVEEARLKLL